MNGVCPESCLLRLHSYTFPLSFLQKASSMQLIQAWDLDSDHVVFKVSLCHMLTESLLRPR